MTASFGCVLPSHQNENGRLEADDLSFQADATSTADGMELVGDDGDSGGKYGSKRLSSNDAPHEDEESKNRVETETSLVIALLMLLLLSGGSQQRKAPSVATVVDTGWWAKEADVESPLRAGVGSRYGRLECDSEMEKTVVQTCTTKWLW